MHNYEGFLQIALARGVGNVTLKRIISFIQNEKISWNDLCHDDVLLHNFLGFKKATLEDIYSKSEIAKRTTENLHKNDVKIIFCNEENYPLNLKLSLGDKSPAFLFYKGQIQTLNKVSVGFCGSRKISEKGLGIASNCVKQLVMQGVAVISGYAAGTDMITHKSALQYSGETIFVLPEGILKSRIKAEIKDLLNENNHIFISQYLPEIIWNAGNAMKRNSVIIGLSKAMILVESGTSGGTFAAGNETLALKHPLFVVDYAQPEASAEANSYFISKGGVPIRGKANVPNLSKVFSIIKNANLQHDSSIHSHQLMLGVE